MNYRTAFLSLSCASLLVLSTGVPPAAAESSHARIIRLSLVQGDVRFTREAHGDPLADQKAVWEKAEANLPVRQGYVLATDDGQAEVEFENGVAAFLNANTVLEFYDLSLEDGARITRLVLRQGSASFFVNPSGEDYFSVTGADFTVQADGKSSFRLNDFDDGTSVALLSGHAFVLHKKDRKPLGKGQYLSMKAGEDSVSIAGLPAADGFDRWVSGRIDTISAATNASRQYTNSASYLPGFADLYTYGAWNSCGSYGYGWRPFGVGLGWTPFSSGQWLWDPSFGWIFASYQPWGWAPYHYGGWLFDASCGGWFYSPPIFYGFGGYWGQGGFAGNPKKRLPRGVHPPQPIFRASTAVFVRQNGQLGIVPLNPLDKRGKPPLNIEHGVFSLDSARSAGSTLLPPEAARKWEIVNAPPRDALNSGLVSTSAPQPAPRTLLGISRGARAATFNGSSSIVYNPGEHRYVSTPTTPQSLQLGRQSLAEGNAPGAMRNDRFPGGDRLNSARGAMTRMPSPPISARSSAPPARSMMPPPAPRSSFGGAGGFRGGGADFSRGGGGGFSRGSSAPSAPAPASAPHVSTPAGGGGGRPH